MTSRETHLLSFLCTVWGAVVYYWILDPPEIIPTPPDPAR